MKSRRGFRKLQDWLFDHGYDLHFLMRNDVSLRFKILNILSMDLLRICVACLEMNARGLYREFDMLAIAKAEFSDLTVDEYDKWIRDGLKWRIDRVVRECEGLWQI